MKWIENAFRNFIYFLFRIFLRNKQVSLPLDGSKIKKILILRYDVLGDMIVTTPVFHLLQEKLPHAEIHVVGTKRNVVLLKHDERISKILCYDETFRSLLELRRLARRENYDCIVGLVFYKATKAGAWANGLVAGRL
ncbi:MAG: glycosyltransferase family 9 protein [Ignavibacteria bacterium]|nr:glycosyltransferase family 9 protein [Ignavibacteria bacterium]